MNRDELEDKVRDSWREVCADYDLDPVLMWARAFGDESAREFATHKKKVVPPPRPVPR